MFEQLHKEFLNHKVEHHNGDQQQNALRQLLEYLPYTFLYDGIDIKVEGDSGAVQDKSDDRELLFFWVQLVTEDNVESLIVEDQEVQHTLNPVFKYTILVGVDGLWVLQHLLHQVLVHFFISDVLYSITREGYESTVKDPFRNDHLSYVHVKTVDGHLQLA